MTDTLSIAFAQLNPTVGAIDANLARIRAARAEAAAKGADLVVCSEAVVIGYPPEDLVLRSDFQDTAEAAVAALAADTADGGPGIVAGSLHREGEAVYNAAFLMDAGAVVAVRHKCDLTNYGPFDEKRIFKPGSLPGPVNFRGVRLGIVICEDMWTPDVVECLEESGAEILLVINGSPTETRKHDQRIQAAVARITESGLPLGYVNQVGGQDQLVFDGASFVLDRDCALRAQAPAWREHLLLTRWCRGPEGRWGCAEAERDPPATGHEAMYRAILLGLRDYVTKNGFPGVLVGLSGGIDSALTAVLAADALGPDRVQAVTMPSPFTPAASLEDAVDTARLLGIGLETLPIAPAMVAFNSALRPLFGNGATGIAAENIQARARGTLLMALSNAGGKLVLATSNKSELAVGYATLYGDMCGGYAPLVDIYKSEIFALARWRNQVRPAGARGPDGRAVPERVLTKPPSAELKPGQTDQDSLPPYDRLDAILDCLVERDMGPAETAAAGHDAETVHRVWRLLLSAEFKRRQGPPGPKITARAFIRDRRYPITNGFTGAI